MYKFPVGFDFKPVRGRRAAFARLSADDFRVVNSTASDDPTADMPPPSQTTEPSPAATDPVAVLLAAGKCKQAVELAKERHKALRSPESERTLIDAYLARIEQFQSKGMTKEAETVIASVRDRFPAHRDRLVDAGIKVAAKSGRIEELVGPLVRPDTSAEVRATIESALRQSWIDLPALAGCGALPADHPLRTAAAALARAFDAVTTGPVDDAQIALSEVSFRSPLSGWKLLVRAIAAYYRQDDAGCRRALESIPADTAVSRLVPVVLGMLDKTPTKVGAAGALQSRLLGDDGPLRESLATIEYDFNLYESRLNSNEIRSAMQSCESLYPDRRDRLAQHIAVAAYDRLNRPDAIRSALKTMPPADSYFWRLLARETELGGRSAEAAYYWQRFLAHAVAENRFGPDSPEAAQVYRRAATLLARVDPSRLRSLRRDVDPPRMVAPFYRDQPPGIAKLAPQPDSKSTTESLDPDPLFERAVRRQPEVETFRQWWTWARSNAASRADDVLKKWSRLRPSDVEPLVLLSESAEARGALTTALNHVDAAEAIDRMNPSVRRARVRLTLGIALRHFKEKKAHLVEKDLKMLTASAGTSDGDRAAVLAALWGAWAALKSDADDAGRRAGEVIRISGPVAGRALLESVAVLAKLPKDFAWPVLEPLTESEDPREVARAQVRLRSLALDTGLKLTSPPRWNAALESVVRTSPCPLSATELLAIGAAAVAESNSVLAYDATAAGLANRSNRPEVDAEFLLLRGQSLDAWFTHQRVGQCIRAALQLARQTHGGDLVDRVLKTAENHPIAKRMRGPMWTHALSDEDLAAVLRSERDAKDFPTSPAEAERFVADIEPPPEDRMDSGPFDLDDDDDDDGIDPDAFDPDAILDSLSPDLRRRLEDAIVKLGKFPSPAEIMRLDPKLLSIIIASMGATGGKRRPR